MLRNGARKNPFRCASAPTPSVLFLLLGLLPNGCYNSTWEGVIGHTVCAHRLCFKAAQVSGQDALLRVIKTIFYTTMAEGKDISDRNVLAEIAESVGFMSKDQVSHATSFDFVTIS